MKRKPRKHKAARSKLVPTHAPYGFYDPLQLQPQQPRNRAWSGKSTAELQNAIDELTTEVLRRAFAGEQEAVDTFALKVSNLVSWLQHMAHRQREKVEQLAARAVFWPVNVTQRDTDFTWAKKYVRSLKVGSKSLLSANIRSRIARHEPFARLAEKLWLQLLKNRDELTDLIKRAGSDNARKLETKWISLCLSLPAARTSQEVSPQDAPKWWRLGEALLLEAWQQDRQSAFGSVLKDYCGPDVKPENRGLSEAEIERDIFKRFKSAFLQLLKSGMSQTQ